MEKQEGYNGWKNYETWNVALWIQNDEGLYQIARGCETYAQFAEMLGLTEYDGTPDGVRWSDSALDIEALDEMIGEL